MKAVITLILASLLTACASSGVEVSDSDISSFQEGKTTLNEIVASLGHPVVKTRSNDGRTIVAYNFFETSVRAASFIPIAGAVLGGADTRGKTVSFTIDADGVLESYSVSEYASSTN